MSLQLKGVSRRCRKNYHFGKVIIISWKFKIFILNPFFSKQKVLRSSLVGFLGPPIKLSLSDTSEEKMERKYCSWWDFLKKRVYWQLSVHIFDDFCFTKCRDANAWWKIGPQCVYHSKCRAHEQDLRFLENNTFEVFAFWEKMKTQQKTSNYQQGHLDCGIGLLLLHPSLLYFASRAIPATNSSTFPDGNNRMKFGVWTSMLVRHTK